MKKPVNSPARRLTIISRRRLEETADRWWEVYAAALGLFTEYALHEAMTDHFADPALWFEKADNRSRAVADGALDAYEQRWPGV